MLGSAGAPGGLEELAHLGIRFVARQLVGLVGLRGRVDVAAIHLDECLEATVLNHYFPVLSTIRNELGVGHLKERVLVLRLRSLEPLPESGVHEPSSLSRRLLR